MQIVEGKIESHILSLNTSKATQIASGWAGAVIKTQIKQLGKGSDEKTTNKHQKSSGSDGLMDGWKDGQMDGWTDGPTDRPT